MMAIHGGAQRLVIRRCWFWVTEDEPALEIPAGDVHVEGCVFWGRPRKWWHLRAWFRALRAWVRLSNGNVL